ILPLTELRIFRESPTIVLAMIEAIRVLPLLVLRLRLDVGGSLFTGLFTGGRPVLHEPFLRTWHRLGRRAAHRATAPAICTPRRTDAAGTPPLSRRRESIRRDL